MPEQTFKSPGFFEREIDLSGRVEEITGIPAGIAGTSEMGPAFVPVTVGSMTDFVNRFGKVKSELFGPFAVREFLRNRTAVTYVRVLGAGANSTATHFSNTEIQGVVQNAGFFITGSTTNANGFTAEDDRGQGNVVFLAGIHSVETEYETAGYPIFTDNRTFQISGGNDVNLVRAMIFCASGSRIEVMDPDESYAVGGTADDAAKISSYDGSEDQGTFKLVLSSALGSTFGNQDGYPGIRVLRASFDPTSKHYISKILNTDPDRFGAEQHLLYGDFAVESEIAKVKYSSTTQTVGVLSGTLTTNPSSGDTGITYMEAFGKFNTRYKPAITTKFISQPFGNTEYDLFHFETITDGESGNSRYKISISNLKRSTNPKDPYGTFSVEVRDYSDTDTNPRILELYPNCTLNPASENYVARLIGDFKAYYDFDAEVESERRLQVTGKHANRSRFVRIIMDPQIENSNNVPKEALPFGFRGLPVPQTTSTLTDDNEDTSLGETGSVRLAFVEGVDLSSALSGSVVPPVPLRFKATRNAVKATASPAYIGESGPLEIADSRLYFGIKFETVPLTGSISNAVLNANASSTPNPLLSSYSKMLGIQKLGTVTSGSGCDKFNDNKFTLGKVALYNQITDSENLYTVINSNVTGSADEHILQAAYIRDKDPVAPKYYVVDDSLSANRLTFASLAAAQGTNAVSIFNRFSNYLKFTNMMYGGFDGVNILDRDMKRLNDKSASSLEGGKAEENSVLLYENLPSSFTPGVGIENNTVVAYRTAAKILTDELSSRINILAIPGIRDSFVTDHASDLVRDYSQAIYLMDIPSYSGGASSSRLYDDSSGRPSVLKTTEQFAARSIDNNYVAAYFPDVKMIDDERGSVVDVPASVAALSAIAYNDNVSYPWFAPAGFNRGALENVANTQLRLTTADRDTLYENRINPIANFPSGGFVIFGQKTLQQAKSALDRVNVRRMLLEVKRIVSDVAYKIVFEQNTPSTRARFVSQVTPLLATIQLQQGIDQFRVIMDSSNNTSRDVEENRLNGRIVLVPTRAVEFIAIDFIVTNSGVSFE